MAKEKKNKISKTSTRKSKMIFLVKVSLILFLVLSWMVIFIDFEVLGNNQYQSLWVHAPSVVEEDEPFYITIEAWDKFERLAGAYMGNVTIQLESYQLNDSGGYDPLVSTWAVHETNFLFTSNFLFGGFFPAYLMPGADNGLKKFNMSISTSGVHYINVTDSYGYSYRSNPVVVKNDTSFDRLYWGDIHAHSFFSDGAGYPSEVYTFARDVALLDFAALTDHSEMFPQFSNYVMMNRLQEYIDITNSFNNDNTFATIVAIEWTPLLVQARSYLCTQHMNFYFSGDSFPFFSTFTAFTPDQVFEYLDENSASQYIAWTHHVLRSDYASDYGFHNQSVNRMIEIYSEHGNGETTNSSQNPIPTTHTFKETDYGYSVQDSLRMGFKYGFMASTDSHDGRMGHPIVHTGARGALHVHPYTLAAYEWGANPGGITGLYASSLTRGNVFDSLYNRSAYATTWVNRHFMNFTINNVAVGHNDSTVIVADNTTTRFLEITAIADGICKSPNIQTNISKVEIFKNSELWRTDIVNDIIYHVNITDTSIITGTNYTHCIQKSDGNWYIHERSLKPVDPSLLTTNGTDYYYVRMTDTNGGLGWIGPIWVDPLA